MKQHILLLILLVLAAPFFLQSQSYLVYDIEPEIVKIEEAHVAAWKKTGKIEGFRIQIAALPSRSGAQAVATEFMAKFSELKAYVNYLEPNFRVRAGNFLTRLDAFRFLQKVQPAYSGAFIVKEPISIKDNY